MNSRFATCLAWLTSPAIEGGYVNDPADRGGATNHGVTQATYDRFRDARNLAHRPVREITMIEVADVYRIDYWDVCRCDDLPIPLDLVVFESAVQHGAGRAVKWLQQVIGTVPDGQCGPKTLYAVHDRALKHQLPDVIDGYLDIRAAYYAKIIANDPSQRKFRNGWENRMNALVDEIA